MSGDSLLIGYFAPVFALAAFLGILLMLEWGRRIGKRRLAEQGPSAREGLSTLEGAIYALTGLLIAFTFSGAASRFDQRRQMVIEETNAIGTAWLRIDLLDEQAREPMRALFRDYTDARIEAYRKLPDLEAAMAHLGVANQLQSRIWATSTRACQAAPGPAPCVLLLDALNTMFDITTTRLASSRMHPPWVIYGVLWLFVLASALLSGQSMAGMRQRDGSHYAIYALVMGSILYVIADIEFPRAGLIRVDDIDRYLEQVRAQMG